MAWAGRATLKGVRNIIVLAGILVLGYFCFDPVVVVNNENYNPVSATYQKGDTVNVLKGFDFDAMQYTAYVIRNDSYVIKNDLPWGKVFKTTDKELLKEMQKNMRFVYSAGDMSTVENQFILMEGGKIAFSANVVTEENNPGMQSREFGWIKSVGENSPSYYFRQFDRLYYPVVKL